MSFQRQHFLQSYFKTMNVGPAKVKLKTSNLADQYLSNWAIDHASFSSIWVSGKLPTYPSPNPTFWPKWEVNVNIELGEG